MVPKQETKQWDQKKEHQSYCICSEENTGNRYLTMKSSLVSLRRNILWTDWNRKRQCHQHSFIHFAVWFSLKERFNLNQSGTWNSSYYSNLWLISREWLQIQREKERENKQQKECTPALAWSHSDSASWSSRQIGRDRLTEDEIEETLDSVPSFRLFLRISTRPLTGPHRIWGVESEHRCCCWWWEMERADWFRNLLFLQRLTHIQGVRISALQEPCSWALIERWSQRGTWIRSRSNKFNHLHCSSSTVSTSGKWPCWATCWWVFRKRLKFSKLEQTIFSSRLLFLHPFALECSLWSNQR